MVNRDKTATSPLLRRLNAGLVLDALRSMGPATGTELIAATGLSRPTVHTVCDHLIEMGWIHELEHRQPEAGSTPGRRARQYQFNARAGYVLGVDLGQNKVTAAVGDLRGDEVGSATRHFAREDIEARPRLTEVRKAIGSALEAAGLDRSAILSFALAVPGPVDDLGHVVAKEEYLPGLAKIDLRTALGKGFDVPVLIENDANLAVLAERWRGCAQGVDNVIELLAGERLGSGLYLGGRLVRGSHGAAGELEFLSMVEGVGNTDGIARLLRVEGTKAVTAGRRARTKSSLIESVDGNPDLVRAETVLSAVSEDDPAAIEALERTTHRIARVIALLHTLLNPELVVIGGAVAEAGDVLVRPLQKAVAELVATPPAIAASALGDHAVVLGAVRRALDQAEASLFPDSLMARQ